MDSKKPPRKLSTKHGRPVQKGPHKASSALSKPLSRFPGPPECEELPGASGEIKWLDHQIIGGYRIFADLGGFRAAVSASHCACCHPDRKLTYRVSIRDTGTKKALVGKAGLPSLEEAVRTAEEELRKLLQ